MKTCNNNTDQNNLTLTTAGSTVAEDALIKLAFTVSTVDDQDTEDNTLLIKDLPIMYFHPKSLIMYLVKMLICIFSVNSYVIRVIRGSKL